MTSPITRLGSFYAERIAKAAARAEEERREAERPRTLDEQIALKVQEFGTYEQVAQQLGQALTQAIKRNVDSLYKVDVVPDVPAGRYVVTVTSRGVLSRPKVERLFINDEALAERTVSKEGFRHWVRRQVGPLLRALFEGRDRFAGGGWYEATGADVQVPAQEREAIIDELAELGVLHDGHISPEEEQRVIDYLMRSLDARPDSSPSPDSP